MSLSLIQASLSGGELPPTLYGMVDLAWYKNSLKTCYNTIVKPYGGVMNRSGSRYVCEVKNDGAARVMPFSFNNQQTYVVEVGVGYLRIVSNGVQQTVSNVATTAWLTATNYALADYVMQANVIYYCLVPHVSGTFATDLAAGNWYALTMLQPGGTGILELKTSYTAPQQTTIKRTQSADVMTFVQPQTPPSQLSRYSDVKWTFQPQTLNSGPFQDVNVDKTSSVWSSANVGTVTLTANKAIFNSTQIGQLFYLEQKDFGQAWEPGKVVAINDVRRANGNYYKALTAGTTGTNIPIGTEDRWNDGGVDWVYLHNGFGVAKITATAVGGLSATADVMSRLPDGTTSAGFAGSINITARSADVAGNTLGTAVAHGLTVGLYGTTLATFYDTAFGVYLPYTTSFSVVDANTILFAWPYTSHLQVSSFKPPVGTVGSASYKWAFGAFGDSSIGGPGYPSAVTYYQQRLCFAGTPLAPDTIWTSNTNDYSNFNETNPILDTDSVVFTMGSSEVNQIKSMVQIGKLLVLTTGSVWVTGTGQATDVLTPSNVSVKLQGYDGASDLPPIGIGMVTLYVENKGQVVHDLSYQWASDSYTGDNLTAKGSHLIDGHYIVDWTFQRAPLHCAWMVRDDGVLLGLTYLREQQVVAWHWHATQGFYESVCCVSEGQEDVLYAVVRRVINGVTKRFIERFDTRIVTDIRDGFFVDCGTTWDGRRSSNTTWSSTMTLSGGTTWDNVDLGLTITGSIAVTVPFSGSLAAVGDVIVLISPTDGLPIRCTITSLVDNYNAHCTVDRTIPAADRNVAVGTWGLAKAKVVASWLIGETLDILGDGEEYAQQVVAGDGTITMTPPAVVVQYGLPFYSDVETLAIAPQTPGETMRDKMKLVTTLRVVVNESRTFWAGPDANHLLKQKTRFVSDNFTAPNVMTDLVDLRINSTWDKNGTTLIRHTGPTPFGLSAIIPEVSFGGA